MVICSKCGHTISFKRLPNGKWCPTNADGSDHFDICRQIQFDNRTKPVCIAEIGVKTKAKNKAPCYDGDIPPWDDSLQREIPASEGYEVIDENVEIYG